MPPSAGRRALSFLRQRLSPALLLLLLPPALGAQGGPPFRTDDPETPGNKHLEINFGWIGDRNPAAGAYQIPDFDLNYGLGSRIQLKYELPIAVEEIRAQPKALPPQPEDLAVGLGNSLLGIKWRFYERHSGDPPFQHRFGTGLRALFTGQSRPTAAAGDSPGAALSPEGTVSFSLSTYPQLSLSNPTRSVARGVVPSGPTFYLPLELNGRLGPLRWDAEAGYNFGNHSLPQTWARGLLLGHEFSDTTEFYLELYNLQDATRVPLGRGTGAFATGGPKQRELTLDLGGRQALNRPKTLNLLFMGGRALQATSVYRSQPSWIAYLGLQVLLGPREP